MAKLGIFAAVIIAAGGASCGVEAWAADAVPTGASAATAASAPKACTDGWSFIATNCQLTWQGITVFGIVDTGVGWQSHGAAFDPKSAVGSSYLIQKQNRGSIWTLAPNALSNSFIGIKGIEPIGGDVFVLFFFVFPLLLLKKKKINDNTKLDTVIRDLRQCDDAR